MEINYIFDKDVSYDYEVNDNDLDEVVYKDFADAYNIDLGKAKEILIDFTELFDMYLKDNECRIKEILKEDLEEKAYEEFKFIEEEIKRRGYY